MGEVRAPRPAGPGKGRGEVSPLRCGGRGRARMVGAGACRRGGVDGSLGVGGGRGLDKQRCPVGGFAWGFRETGFHEEGGGAAISILGGF